MASEFSTASEPGITSLVKGIINDIEELIKEQFQFARTEIRADLKKTGAASGLLAAGLALAGLGVLVLAFMLVHLLHWLTSPPAADPAGLPLWACFAIIGGLFLLAGGGLALAGKEKFSSFNPLPDQTVETVKENLQLKTHVK